MTEENDSMVCAGIDVSKSKLDIFVLPGSHHLVVDYSSEGLKELDCFLKRHKVARIGFEASGGYEWRLIEHLRQSGIPAARLQPVQVRAFGKAKLKRAKTDKLDAKLIAAFTASLERLPELPSELEGELAEHLTFIEQIEDQLVVLKTSLETTRNARIRQILTRNIRRTEARREAELMLLTKRLRASDELARRLDRVVSIKGFGLRTGLALVIRLPELGSMTREEIAAMAGLAPFNNDSGKRSGKRSVQGGRLRLRKSLFMAGFSAIRWNPGIKAFYNRLRLKEKHHLTALIASMRKLIILANALVAQNRDWTPERP